MADAGDHDDSDHDHLNHIPPMALLARSGPSDEVVSHPTFNASRAATLRGQSEDIWP